MHLLQIDEEVIKQMPEEDLRQYIPLYGDRMAAKQFCNNREKPNRKMELLKKLQNKIKRKSEASNGAFSGNEEDESGKRKKSGNWRSTRQVEIGWMCSLDGEKYKQIRSQTGGGTRKVCALKTMKKSDLIQKGIEIFFPGNISKMGKLEEFSLDLMDFKLSTIEDNVTVEDMFRATKFSNSKVRVYLATKEKIQTVTRTASDEETQINTESYTENPLNNSSLSFSLPSVVQVSVESNERQEQLEIPEINHPSMFLNDADPNVVVEYENDFTRFYSNYIPIYELEHTSSIPQNQNDITEIHRTNNADSTTTAPEPALSPIAPERLEYNLITLRRGSLFEDLLQKFMTLDKDGLPIQIKMKGYNGVEELGEDIGGVFRDSLSAFWSCFMDRCTVGANVKIPYIRHDFNAEKWEAIALILYRGYKETNYFPIEIAKVFMEMVIFDRRLSDLIESFLSYVSSDDKVLLEKAMSNFDNVDQEALLDILSDLGCKTHATERNISTLLEELAHKELIQRGMFVINAWQKVLRNFISEEEFSDIYRTKQINSKNLLSLLSPSDLDAEKTTIFNYLRKFIRESSVLTLKQLLRFCTGADVIIGRRIQVNFNQRYGLDMVPTSHTCSCILELPVNYHDYPEFRSDFNSVLNSTDWSIDLM